MKLCLLFSLLALVGVSLAMPVAAAPYLLTYEGRITEPSGKPVEGPIDMAVEFFRTAEGGTSILNTSVTFSGITLQEGIFSLEISLLPADFHTVFPDTDQAVWIQVTDVTHSLVYPRQRFSMIPYALKVPVDGKTVTFNEQGQLAVAPNSLPAAGQFLTKDSSGNLVWQAPSATSLQGQAIDSATVPTAGQVLKFDGTKWTPSAAASSSGGTVTAVAIGSGPLAVANATTTPSISMTQASSVSNGYLTSADYLSFQAKEAAITAGTSAQYFRGDKTWQTLGTSATVDAGTTANKMVQLDGSARIPAVDGSLITSLNPANLSAAVSVAKGGTGSATGSITGTTALTLAAGGTNQNVTLTPSGTGYTLLNGNVGIGTTSPAARLDVSGKIRSSGLSILSAGSNAAPDLLTGQFIDLSLPAILDVTTANGATVAGYAAARIGSPLIFGVNGSSPGVTYTDSRSLVVSGAPRASLNTILTNTAALYIDAENVAFGGSAINSYGLFVNAQTGASNNVAAVFQGGNVGIGTTSPGAQLQVNSSAASTAGLIVRGAASQTASVAEWQESSGLPTAYHRYDSGVPKLGVRIPAAGSANYLQMESSSSAGPKLSFGYSTLGGNGERGSIVGLASNSGEGMHYDAAWAGHWFSASGAGKQLLVMSDAGSVTVNPIGTTNGVPNSGAASLNVISNDAAKIGSIIQGAASQTANLTEWRDSTGTSLTVVDETGRVGIGTTNPASKLEVSGEISTGAGGVRWKTFSGTTDGDDQTQFAHGLTASKIIMITCSIIYSTNYYSISSLSATPSTRYVMWDDTNATLQVDADSNWYSKPYRCIAQYVD